MRDAAVTVRKLGLQDVDEAADVLVRAFFDYPMWTWILPGEAHRRKALPIAMRSSIRWGLLLDATYGAGEPLAGVAVWAPPGMADADPDADGTITHYNEAVEALGPDANARMDLFVAQQRVLRDRHIGPKTWYLSWLGVGSAQQRSGMGGALLRHMLATLDADGGDVYLETERAANVPYYQRHDFTVTTEGTIADGGPQFWAMKRPAGGTAAA